MRKIGLMRWIKENRAEIDEIIEICNPRRVKQGINDNDHRKWVLNDEYLYFWAKKMGVKL